MIEFLLGAIWRAVDGYKSKPKGWNLLIVPIVFGVFYYHNPFYWHEFADYWYYAALPATCAVVLLQGFKDWNDADLMLTHFAGLPAVAMVALGAGSVWSVAALVLAGLTYPVVMRVNPHYLTCKKLPWLDNNRVAEFISGGLVALSLSLM